MQLFFHQAQRELLFGLGLVVVSLQLACVIAQFLLCSLCVR